MTFIRMFAPREPEPVPALPPGFNVRVEALEPAYAKAVRRAVEDGWLDGYTTEGKLYVNETDLFDLAGNGADTSDPHGGCYIPSWAKIPQMSDDGDRQTENRDRQPPRHL